jgi:hypothetical protein
MNSIKDMVKDGKKVKFTYYRKNELWYVTECGFEFPVPIEDCGDASFLAEDKAMMFMRYIRKHIATVESEKADVESFQSKLAKNVKHGSDGSDDITDI